MLQRKDDSYLVSGKGHQAEAENYTGAVSYDVPNKRKGQKRYQIYM
jgi:hypothetical protein